MPTWVAVLGSGGALGGLFALIKHRMDLRFYRDMAERFGLDGLDAASRAAHPLMPRTAPPPDEETPPAPPTAAT